MKTTDDFQKFYDTVLINDLQPLEETRKKFVKRFNRVCIIFVLVIAGATAASIVFQGNILSGLTKKFSPASMAAKM